MLIYNVKINTMEDEIIENGYVEIEDGIISKVESGVPQNISDEDIDGNGANLYPGFIDAHTHLGVFGDGLGFEAEDANETTDPVTPQLRIIDAINPFDRCFEETREAGITTAVVSPGSANAICGEITAIKTFGKRIDDMIIKTIGMKFALGENPKNVYNDKDSTPVTRMAIASLMRENLHKAKKYYDDTKRAVSDEDFDPPEYDMKCESLMSLLKGEIRAHFHAHRADDICTAIRIAKEFNIKYVIVHATEGHKIAEILADEKAKCIVGPIISDRSKPELKDHDIKNAGILEKNGVEFCLCTDHPVIPLQYLFTTAAATIKGGLSKEKALKAITIDSAKIAGIDHKVGSIKVGKDADLVLVNGDPFDMLTTPEIVIINGKIVHKK